VDLSPQSTLFSNARPFSFAVTGAGPAARIVVFVTEMADYSGASHQVALCADPVGSNPLDTLLLLLIAL
jgi:hypothetical protein